MESTMIENDHRVEWLPFRTERAYRRLHAATWIDHGEIIPEYTRHLAAIGIVNPTPQAVATFATAVRLRDAAEQQPVEAKRDDVAERLASGDLLLDDAAKMLIKRPDTPEAEARLREHQRNLEEASRIALLRAVLLIHDYGEAEWLKLLKPVAADAVAKHDQRLFDAVHAFAAYLREPMRKRMFGLAAAMLDHVTDADPYYYAFKNPRLVYLWQVEHAVGHQAREMSTRPIDGVFRIAYDVTRAPLPTVRDFRPEWGAGLYSAQEAIENTIRSLDEQEAEFAPRESDAPAPPKRGRVVMT
jgi:hypothetical protein